MGSGMGARARVRVGPRARVRVGARFRVTSRYASRPYREIHGDMGRSREDMRRWPRGKPRDPAATRGGAAAHLVRIRVKGRVRARVLTWLGIG